ncbi:acyltransferase family protein [Subtercola lobariae]|uniref:Acyltransferase n=1 Tax=Subtercola lobariae TaxID=1588641 RepID=A0A917ETX6_9MICO|nr:acyltransferase family protein [Subtercola lobariae]GGF12948.1 acyltransferase [Subtercola lobariae]
MASTVLSKPATRQLFRFDIQGLRAIAILLVVIDHMNVVVFSGGFIGVDVFFVISGFLITSHLLSQLRQTGTIRFADFYARRMRRILPASFFVLIVTTVASFIFMPPLVRSSIVQGAIATALYVPNMLLAALGTDYQAETAPSPFQHYWSLGVEEQFYLFWPIILFVLWRVLRNSRRGLAIAVALLALISFILCIVILGRSQPYAFFSLPTRAWEFAIGGLVGIASSTGRVFGKNSAIAAALGWAGIAVLVVTGLVFTDTTLYPGFPSLLPVLSTALVIFVGTNTQSFGPEAGLRWRPLQYIGKISYSLYLWHFPLLVIPQAAVGLDHPLPVWVKVVLMVVAVGLADLTYRFIEEPFRKNKRITSIRPSRTLLAGLAASVLVVGLTAAAAIPLSNFPTSSGQVAASGPLTVPPVATGFVPSNMQPTLEGAPTSTSEIHRDGCHIDSNDGTKVNDCEFGDLSSATTVVLFGDSHAAHWFPAVDAWAEGAGVRLLAYTKVGCPGIDVSVTSRNAPYMACDTWRDGVMKQLDSVQPALVILSYSREDPLTSASDPELVWSQGLAQTRAQLPATTKIMVVSDTPEFNESAPDCLSANLTDALACSAPRVEALDSTWAAAQKATVEQLGGSYLDLSDYFCTPTECDPVIGNTLVYRDTSHITEVWSAKFGGVFGEEAEKILH